MAKAPRCKICKQPYWGTCDHSTLTKAPTVSPPKVALPSLGAERTAVEVLYTELGVCRWAVLRCAVCFSPPPPKVTFPLWGRGGAGGRGAVWAPCFWCLAFGGGGSKWGPGPNNEAQAP